MVRITILITTLLSIGCVSAPPAQDKAASQSAIQTMKSQGVGVWAEACWEHTQFPGARPYLLDESLALATSWGITLNNHLATHGIDSNTVRVPMICPGQSNRRLLQSREDQTALGRGTPNIVDNWVQKNPSLKSGLETVHCQVVAKSTEQYPLLAKKCDKTLSPVAKNALFKYFRNNRYILIASSRGQSQSMLTGVVASALFLPAIALTSGVTGITVAGPATLGGSNNAAQPAIRLVDSGGPTGNSTTGKRDRIFSHGYLYDIKTQSTLWVSNYADTQIRSCGIERSPSREASRIFGQLLCQ